jgi:putative polyhydroxyalkanoate system protein
VANLHILRKHSLGLPAARKVAFQWAEQVERDFDMACTYEEGDVQDEVAFTRSGVSGSLQVTKDSFELNAQLGFLLGVFKDRIEGEITQILDGLLLKSAAPKKPAAKKAGVKKA